MTMGINVDHIAALARLRMDEEERRRMERDLHSILRHAERLFRVDVTGVEPTFGSSDIACVRLEEDVPRDGLSRDEVLRQAPSVQGPYFKVPREGSAGSPEDGGRPNREGM